MANSSTHCYESVQLRNGIANLLVEVDREAAQFKNMVTDLLAQADALRSVTIGKEALEHLVLQLREANQNLVIATFGAQDLQAKAEFANHQQEEFLSMLAHELRNPLAPVSMAAELLGKITDAHPQLPKIHAVISRQTHHMSHMVNDLVDASRVQNGKITLHKQPHLLSEIIDSAVETGRPFIEKRRQQLTINREALYRLVAVLTGMGVTVLMTAELEDQYTFLRFSSYGNAFLADAIIMQRYVEISGQFRRILSVVKVRASDHSKDICFFEIAGDKITIGEPLTQYQGILSGQPTKAS